MRALLLFLYSFGLQVYILAVRVASAFNPKARELVAGHKQLLQQIEQQLKPGEKRIWFHFASLGEFEQGRPVMEQLRTAYPSYKLLITFFSPSGYSIRKNYEGADYVFYLPFDSAKNARRFLNAVNPSLVVFVKYEFWLHYLREISIRNIPALLISAVFRPDQVFFKPVIGNFFTSFLSAFRVIFLQNHDSEMQAKKLGLTICRVAGDTRFDRVKAIMDKRKPMDEVRQFVSNREVLVAGSSWPYEEALISGVLHNEAAKNLCFVIVPHDVSLNHIRNIRMKIPDAITYSEWDKQTTRAKVLVIDQVGMLSSVYQFAHVALVGGGFGNSGLHNILEAAVFGVPVLFGPNIGKFWEAGALAKAGGALVIQNEEHFKSEFDSKITNREWRMEAGRKAAAFVESHTGATTLIINEINANHWLNEEALS